MRATPTLEDRRSMGSGPLTGRYDEALQFVSWHQRWQLRKGSRVPYLSHLMSVSALVLEHGGTEDEAIAGLLHDAIEDAPQGAGAATAAEIERRFGASVARMVRECSDGLGSTGERHGTWAERKLPYLAALEHKAEGSLRVTAADKTHNASCIANDIETYGEQFWTVFNACPHQLAWYYRGVQGAVAGRLPGSSAAHALTCAVDRLLAVSGMPEPNPDVTLLPDCACGSSKAVQG